MPTTIWNKYQKIEEDPNNIKNSKIKTYKKK